MNQADPRKILENSTVIADRQEVEAAVEQIADDINAHYGDRSIILLVVMTGAIMPAAWIAARLKMPLQMDFIHATRYSGTTEGGDIEFRVPPRLNLQPAHCIFHLSNLQLQLFVLFVTFLCHLLLLPDL